MTTKMVTAGPWTPAFMISSMISSTTRFDNPSRLQQVVSGLKEREGEIKQLLDVPHLVSGAQRGRGKGADLSWAMISG